MALRLSSGLRNVGKSDAFYFKAWVIKPFHEILLPLSCSPTASQMSMLGGPWKPRVKDERSSILLSYS